MSDEADEKQRRIVEARLKLRERFFQKMKDSPGVADGRPQGTGPKNRHGMPQLPVGQHHTQNWPVLDLGVKVDVQPATWALTIDGAVEAPVTLDWAAFHALPQVEDQSDFHCVTTWSLMDSRWKGVRFSALMGLVRPTADATHVMTYAYDGYTTNVPLEEALKDDVLLVHRWNGQPLPREHGGPVRMITPQLYAWKGAKWINRIEVLTRDKKGFWEVRGYSNSAHPWRDDRYS
jgi:DMSO/TMAO reductase YedYZ molybdopterin-dependent catalytic subunit